MVARGRGPAVGRGLLIIGPNLVFLAPQRSEQAMRYKVAGIRPGHDLEIASADRVCRLSSQGRRKSSWDRWLSPSPALPERARPLGLPNGRRPPLRQARRAQRRVLGRALGLAHGGSTREISDWPRSAGPMGAPIAAVLLCRSNRRKVQRRDRADRGPRPQGRDHLRYG